MSSKKKACVETGFVNSMFLAERINLVFLDLTCIVVAGLKNFTKPFVLI